MQSNEGLSRTDRGQEMQGEQKKKSKCCFLQTLLRDRAKNPQRAQEALEMPDQQGSPDKSKKSKQEQKQERKKIELEQKRKTDIQRVSRILSSIDQSLKDANQTNDTHFARTVRMDNRAAFGVADSIGKLANDVKDILSANRLILGLADTEIRNIKERRKNTQASLNTYLTGHWSAIPIEPAYAARDFISIINEAKGIVQKKLRDLDYEQGTGGQRVQDAQPSRVVYRAGDGDVIESA